MRELSAGDLGETVCRDRALAPGAGAGGNAVVDGGAEELLETVGGFEVKGGILSSWESRCSVCSSSCFYPRIALWLPELLFRGGGEFAFILSGAGLSSRAAR